MNHEEAARQLASIEITLPHGQTKTLSELVAGWEAHVARLHHESDSSRPVGPLTWGAHDYLAALNLRSLASQGVEQAPPEVQEVANSALSSADGILKSFTRLDVDGWVERFAGEHHGNSEWWWRRIPESGPVRSEIRSVIENLRT